MGNRNAKSKYVEPPTPVNVEPPSPVNVEQIPGNLIAKFNHLLGSGPYQGEKNNDNHNNLLNKFKYLLGTNPHSI